MRRPANRVGAFVNPLAKFLAAIAIGFGLILTLSPQAAAFVLIVDLVALPFFRFSLREVMRILGPLVLIAGLSALTTALYGRPSGMIFAQWGLVNISQGSLLLALAIGLRILAIGVAGVALIARIDATELADSLTQLWRLPRRFVLGTLAAFRLLNLLLDDWRTLEMARRARGLGSGRGPFAAISRLSGQAFSLLVLSIRRGTTIALAMEARGINAPGPVSHARIARWRARDWMLVTGATVAAAVALAIGISTGGFVV